MQQASGGSVLDPPPAAKCQTCMSLKMDPPILGTILRRVDSLTLEEEFTTMQMAQRYAGTGLRSKLAQKGGQVEGPQTTPGKNERRKTDPSRRPRRQGEAS